VAACLGSATPAGAVTVDGQITPGEWTEAWVIITDPNEPNISEDHDIHHIVMMADASRLYVGVSVYGDHIELGGSGPSSPYLSFYFTLSATDGQRYRFGLTHDAGLAPGQVHLSRFAGGWTDLGVVESSLGPAVEAAVPWSMLPAELTHSGPATVEDVFFLYNVAPGDANGDGAVDVSDIAVVANNFGAAGGWVDGDFNLDGRVDVMDLSIVANRYGNRSPGGARYDMFDKDTVVHGLGAQPPSAPAPEPVTMLGVFLGVSGLAGYIRKRRTD